MSKGETLYVKDMNSSESEEGEENVLDDKVWDDRMLNNAYDKALRIANADVAKIIAMSTNTQEVKSRKNKSSKRNSCKNLQKWTAGMPCRAVYDCDGSEYEANLVKIIDERECVVRFLGYENSEIVSLDSLKPTQGKNVRRVQIEDARNDKTDQRDMHQMETSSDRMQSSGSATTDRSSQRKKKYNKNKKNQHQPLRNGFNLPMNFSLPENLGSTEIPMPPPPPVTSLGRDDVENKAISSMLLSWYMSGYYAGLYQGMRKSKDSRRN